MAVKKTSQKSRKSESKQARRDRRTAEIAEVVVEVLASLDARRARDVAQIDRDMDLAYTAVACEKYGFSRRFGTRMLKRGIHPLAIEAAFRDAGSRVV